MTTAPTPGRHRGRRRDRRATSPVGRCWRRARGRDRGDLMVSLMLLVVVVLAGAGLIVDGGRVMAARRHASNIAEAAARAAVSSTTPVRSFTEPAARAAALDSAVRSGVAPADVEVVVGVESVTVTITERRRSVFLVLGGWETVTVRGTGTAKVVYSG